MKEIVNFKKKNSIHNKEYEKTFEKRAFYKRNLFTQSNQIIYQNKDKIFFLLLIFFCITNLTDYFYLSYTIDELQDENDDESYKRFEFGTRISNESIKKKKIKKIFQPVLLLLIKVDKHLRRNYFLLQIKTI